MKDAIEPATIAIFGNGSQQLRDLRQALYVTMRFWGDELNGF